MAGKQAYVKALFLSCVTDWCVGGYSATDRRRKNRNEFDYGGNVYVESMMAVRRG